MLYSTIYPPPRTPASLTWVPQSRLAFGHHHRVGWTWGPSALGHHNPTVWNFACRWQIQLALQADQESFSNETHPISLIVGPQATASNCLTATVGQRPLFSKLFEEEKNCTINVTMLGEIFDTIPTASKKSTENIAFLEHIPVLIFLCPEKRTDDRSFHKEFFCAACKKMHIFLQGRKKVLLKALFGSDRNARTLMPIPHHHHFLRHFQCSPKY